MYRSSDPVHQLLLCQIASSRKIMNPPSKQKTKGAKDAASDMERSGISLGHRNIRMSCEAIIDARQKRLRGDPFITGAGNIISNVDLDAAIDILIVESAAFDLKSRK